MVKDIFGCFQAKAEEKKEVKKEEKKEESDDDDGDLFGSDSEEVSHPSRPVLSRPSFSVNLLFVYQFTHSCTHSHIHLFTHSFIFSFIYSHIYSPNYLPNFCLNSIKSIKFPLQWQVMTIQSCSLIFSLAFQEDAEQEKIKQERLKAYYEKKAKSKCLELSNNRKLFTRKKSNRHKYPHF